MRNDVVPVRFALADILEKDLDYRGEKSEGFVELANETNEISLCGL